MTGDTASRNVYMSRLNQIKQYIKDNLAEDLSLENLAQRACFSQFHFHRIFTSICGETPNEYVNRVRLDCAANMLLKNPGLSITEIALRTGFSSPAVFSRSFRGYFCCSASTWRKGRARDQEPLDRLGARDHGPLDRVGARDQEPLGRLGARGGFGVREEVVQNVVVRPMPRFHVAYIASQEGYQLYYVKAAWDALCQWAAARDLLTPEAGMIGISYDDPDITPEDKCLYLACMTVPEDVRPDHMVGVMDVAGGKYAMYRYTGQAEGIQTAFKLLFAEWLLDSGYQPADAPCYELYHSTPDTNPDGFYSLDICLPVVPL